MSPESLSPNAAASVRQWRRQARTLLLERRVAAGGKLRKRWNAAISDKLRALLESRRGQIVALYWPFKGEFDDRALMRDLHECGVQVALPAVVEPRTPLEFRVWRPGAEMEPGVYKIPVPKAREVVVPDVIVAPLVGFDAEGYRLGYGGGYYDRTLAAMPVEPCVVGVGYEISRLETLYPQPHDVAMHRVVTEAGVYDFRRPSQG